MHTCFFIGHRDAPNSIQEQLNQIVEELVRDHHIAECIVGCHGEFDRMATIAVREAKQKYSQLRAYRLTAYHPQDRRLTVPDLFDDLYYPAGMETVPRRYAIKKANRIALEESDHLIAYVRRDGGNASEILRHAKRMEKSGRITIINLADM